MDGAVDRMDGLDGWTDGRKAREACAMGVSVEKTKQAMRSRFGNDALRRHENHRLLSLPVCRPYCTVEADLAFKFNE